MNKGSVLSWADVRPAAEMAFAVWVGQPELKWAEQAWNFIVFYGLAEYSNEQERYRVCLRFMTLGGLYNDWWHVVEDETGENDPVDEWAEMLGLSPFKAGQIIAADGELTEGEHELVLEVLRSGIGQVRPEVVDALKGGFGGDIELFLSLWRSMEDDWKLPGYSSSQKIPHTDEEILDHAQYSILMRWFWDGCPSLNREYLYDR